MLINSGSWCDLLLKLMKFQNKQIFILDIIEAIEDLLMCQKRKSDIKVTHKVMHKSERDSVRISKEALASL